MCLLLIAASSVLRAQDVQIEPGGSLPFLVCVWPPPSEQIYIWWWVSANPNSGFHDHHSSSRPNGRLDPQNGGWSGAEGCLAGAFYEEGRISGVYEIGATDGYSYDTLQVYVIQTPYFQWLPPYYAYQLVGATDRHQINHYGTLNVVYAIQAIAEEFYSETGLAAGMNDMSLPWGGVFDLNGDWDVPHQTHQFGRNVDMPFQFLGTAEQRQRFRQIAIDHGAQVADEGNHYHLTFSS